jgi:hypothetical protein
MATTLINTVLTAAFQPSSPFLVTDKKVVLDFLLTIPNPAVAVEWYPEYADGIGANGQALPIAGWQWYRETSEEDVGQGDVRMNEVIRRFAPNLGDGMLAVGAHALNVQLQRTHAFCRIQIRGDGVAARVSTPFGEIPTG